MTLREFKRRTNKWSNDIELTIGFNGKIYDVVDFCGFMDHNFHNEGIKRETICFLPEPNGQD